MKFTFHVPAWTPSPASMRSPTISPSKAHVRSLYFSTLSGEHARKTLSPMPLGPTSVPALLLRHRRDAGLACVPLGLESLGLALPAVALATLGTSYVMVGIDQIGLELEQPFQLLPMNSLAAALTRDVCDEMKCVH